MAVDNARTSSRAGQYSSTALSLTDSTSTAGHLFVRNGKLLTRIRTLHSTPNRRFPRWLRNPRVSHVSYMIASLIPLLLQDVNIPHTLPLFLQLPFHLRLGLPRHDFQSRFPTQNCIRIPLLMTCPHLPHDRMFT